MEKIDNLIQEGQKFTFRNNSYSVSHGTYTRASDELLGWIATVEDFIHSTYGDESAAYRLYLTFKREKLNGYEQDEFEKQMNILNGALKACMNISPKPSKKQIDDNQVIQLIKNFYFWTVLVIISGGAFGFGLHFGASKFDKEKSEFYETTKSQEIEISSLKNNLLIKDTEIVDLNKTISSLQDSLANFK
jgi:hypothetical protein